MIIMAQLQGRPLPTRFIRAMEHWRGNTDLTLTALIIRAVKQGVLADEVKAC